MRNLLPTLDTPRKRMFLSDLAGPKSLLTLATDDVRVRMREIELGEKPVPVLRFTHDGLLYILGKEGADNLINWHACKLLFISMVLMETVELTPAQMTSNRAAYRKLTSEIAEATVARARAVGTGEEEEEAEPEEEEEDDFDEDDEPEEEEEDR